MLNIKKNVTVIAPATTANLGPGFDAVGLALDLHNRVEIEVTEPGTLSIEIAGEGSDIISTDETNLLYRAAARYWSIMGVDFRKFGLKIRCINGIPVSRGLGSSSAAIVGGVVAADRIIGSPASKEDLVRIAADIEGHPDNVAPSILGGIVISAKNGDCRFGKDFIFKRIDPPKDLKAIVAIPDYQLSTEQARVVVPSSFPKEDSIFNIGRTALLVSSLMSGDFEKLKYAMQDRLHQPYRAKLIPGLYEVLDAAVENGAYGAALSGSGPTLIAFAGNDRSVCRKVADAMKMCFKSHKINCETRILSISGMGAADLTDL